MMHFIERLNTPGEHALVLQGAAGSIEAVLTVPDTLRQDYVAFLGHPHSLQGGTMNNKVVTTLARAFKERGIPSLRFNFRGVGATGGVYDAGIGESEDMQELVRLWKMELPESKVFFAGFSFGSYVAYRAATQCAHAGLITVAPPVHHYDYALATPAPYPWLIIQGDADEVVPYSDVSAFAKKQSPEIPMHTFADTGHFFHGKLLELKAHIMEFVQMTSAST